MHVSTQVPHQVRSGVAQALGLPERSIRVIAPDVGGGFGLKCVVGREEVAVAAAALRLRRPVRWTEDRQENLTAAFHGHEQRYRVKAAFRQDGRILGLDAEIDCDTGAYSAFPFTCAVEPLMAATELPGVYKVPAYRARGRAIATNKAPAAPYRGVSRPQIVLVMERLMEKAAAALELGPLQVRRANLIGKHEFPYTGVNKITYDEGSYRESLDLAEQIVTEKAWAAERDTLRRAGRRAGIGYACFSERTAYGTPAMSQRRMRMTPGYDTALVRMDPTGEVIVTTGTCGHGQGHETTFAQIVADRLGVHPGQVRLRQGDTDLASYGWGTWGSRSVVIGGGAAGRAADVVAGQLRKVAASQLEASAADIELAEGVARVRGDDQAAIPIPELARLVYFQAHRLAEDLRYGLEARATFDPPGTFSNACHAAMVVIDPGTCAIRLHRYLVVEDCGVVINPIVVDGQVRGGVTQGAAAALLERVRFDPEGQPVSATLMDYLAPTAAEMCAVDIVHLQTPSQFSETGAKGMGEGGTIGAPAAVLGAINDALSDTDVRFDHIPVLPQDLSAALSQLEPSREGHARHQPQGQRPRARAGGRGPPDAGRHAPPRPGLYRHPSRLRARHLRGVHGDPRRRAGTGLPGLRGAGRRRRGAHRGGAGRRRAAVGPAAGVQRSSRAAVRVLHSRLPHARRGLLRRRAGHAAHRGSRPRAGRRQLVPLHRLPGHHRGRAGHRSGPRRSQRRHDLHRGPAATPGRPAAAARARPVR